MGSYDRDRVPPVFMDHGDEDYGVHLTYTERYFESLEEPPSRFPSSVVAGALRADRRSVHGLTDSSPTSDRRPEGPLPPSGPTLEES